MVRLGQVDLLRPGGITLGGNLNSILPSLETHARRVAQLDIGKNDNGDLRMSLDPHAVLAVFGLARILNRRYQGLCLAAARNQSRTGGRQRAENAFRALRRTVSGERLGGFGGYGDIVVLRVLCNLLDRFAVAREQAG